MLIALVLWERAAPASLLWLPEGEPTELFRLEDITLVEGVPPAKVAAPQRHWNDVRSVRRRGRLGVPRRHLKSSATRMRRWLPVIAAPAQAIKCV